MTTGQANLEMYTEEAVKKREALRSSPQVLSAINSWWRFIGGGDLNTKTGYITKDQFIQMSKLTEEAMDPSNYDERLAREGVARSPILTMLPDIAQ